MVTINISNRAAYTILAVFLIILIAGIVYAVDTSQPWHSPDQIEGGVCNLEHDENCPVVPTGNDTYIEPSGSYIRGACQPTCNAEIVIVPHDPQHSNVPNCTDYESIGKVLDTSLTCTRSYGGVVCEFIEGGIWGDDKVYCAYEQTKEAQLIGEQIKSN